MGNPCARKPGTGHRAEPTADEEQLSPHRVVSLDDAIEYLSADELLEVTPAELRLRKRERRHVLRERAARKARTA